MIDQTLLQYGVAGIFILYLIYDRQVLIKGLRCSIDALTEAIKKSL